MKKSVIIIWFALTVFIVISGSFLSVKLLSDKNDENIKNEKITITAEMTIQDLIEINNLPDEVVRKVFSPGKYYSLNMPVSDYTTDNKKLMQNIEKSLALYKENKTKNWFKIPLKFALWILFMGLIFVILKNKKIKPRNRILFYSAGVIIFGIILGADPSPMGTVKDAIALYGESRVIFMPRMIAMLVFLLMVFAANKMICSWGCQFGMLQDLIFRLNRNKEDRKGIMVQFKIPFIITNSIRVIFFTAFTLIAVIWAYDIISPVDPFKIFKPQFLMIPGAAMLVILLVSSLFIYRPWCHLFCPFGLAGWLVEKISRYKISVDYSRCTSCLACEKACPSTVMSAILRQDKIIPDCFSCGTCINACRFDAINFSSAKRIKPDINRFVPVKSHTIPKS